MSPPAQDEVATADLELRDGRRVGHGGGDAIGPPRRSGARPSGEGRLGSPGLRKQARELAMAAPAAGLREGLQLAIGLPAWADSACTAMENELTAGQPGEATREWVLGFPGLTCVLLAAIPRVRDPGPASAAVTAVVLFRVRAMIRALWPLIPAASFGVLSDPVAGPAFLIRLLTS